MSERQIHNSLLITSASETSDRDFVPRGHPHLTLEKQEKGEKLTRYLVDRGYYRSCYSIPGRKSAGPRLTRAGTGTWHCTGGRLTFDFAGRHVRRFRPLAL